MKSKFEPLDNMKEVPKTPLVKHPIFVGLIVVGVFLGFFAIWSIFFPIETAAIAHGKVDVGGKVKTIQHLEGGIIKSIHVDDGALVKKGQLLLTLDPTQARARENSSFFEYLALLAKEARLLAEKDNAKDIKFPAILSEYKTDKRVADNVSGQVAIFSDNKEAYEKLMESLDEKIAHLKVQVNNLQDQVKSEQSRYDFVEKETKAALKLLPKKFIGQNEVWRLQRESAQVMSAINEHKAEIAQAKQQISQTKLQKIAERNRIRKEILSELRKTQREITQVYETYQSSKDVATRSKILAPISGTIVNMKFHTIGGVVKEGEKIMDIVPQEEELVIEAKIKPIDIDVVHVGMPAKVQLTAYLSRHTPTLKGIVTHVSADAVQDQQTNEYYYDVTVKIDPGQLSKLRHVKLYPGMPADVLVITDKKNFLNYFLTPITSSFNRAFRSQ